MAPLVQRANQADMGHAAPALLNVWIYFNLVSNTVLLPILVATFLFSKRAKRHPTLVNVCMTWIFSGIFSLLLFYAGQERGPEPQKALCIAQTSFLYGITPMWAVAVLVLLCNMIFVNRAAAPNSRVKMIAMLSAPYIAQIAFSTAALVGSLQHPEHVSRARRFFYCTLKLQPLSMAMALFTAIVGVGIGIAMIYLSVLLYRNWSDFRHTSRPSHGHGQLLLRVFIFGGYVVFGFAVNIISMVAPHNLAPDLYAATIGTVLFLVFGTQADVLRTWCFWMSDDARPQTVYIARKPSWRELHHTENVAREQDRYAQWEQFEKEKKEWIMVWGEVARPPTAVARP